jgi:hypothetical protein
VNKMRLIKTIKDMNFNELLEESNSIFENMDDSRLEDLLCIQQEMRLRLQNESKSLSEQVAELKRKLK